MARAPSCPDPRRLQRLLLGALPEPAAVALEQHVESCPLCGQALDALREEDVLVRTIRASACSLPDTDRDAVTDLIRQVKAMRVAPSAITAADTPRPAAGTPEPLTFLDPPQASAWSGRRTATRR
jgi:hypothetical protein